MHMTMLYYELHNLNIITKLKLHVKYTVHNYLHYGNLNAYTVW